MKRLLLICGGCILLLGGLFWFRGPLRSFWQDVTKPALPSAQEFLPRVVSSSVPVSPVPVVKPIIKPSTPPATKDPFVWEGALPIEKNLAVPFLSQAPTLNWAMPFQEACEEASAIMVDAFYRGQRKAFTPQNGEKAILALVDYEENKLGLGPDITVAQIADVLKKYFGYSRTVMRTIKSADELKAPLAHGYPVIIPAAGKMLANPNFRNGGPLYHMLVVKGYTKDGLWITNDPGTRKGADFLYTSQNLEQAIHDWNGGNVATGTQRVLVVLPN